MALATECWDRVCVVVSNATNLCALINVADEQHYLQKCMSPEAFQECIAGDTNMSKVQILCQKMVHEITAGNMDLFNALCTYFLDRSEAYKSMYQRFTAIGGNSSNAVQSELLSLQERVKELTEELQNLREFSTTTDYQSELVAVREIFTENETASQSDESVPVYADVVANQPMEVEKLEPTVVAEEPLLTESQLSPCTIDNKPEEIQIADDVPGDDKENDNDTDIDEVHNVTKTDATNETMNQGYQCEYCTRKCRYKTTFVKHVRTHNGKKPFACQYCEKRFSRKGNLLKHCWTHPVEKPFACEYCEKRFSLKGSLRQHVRVHTAEKPYVCEHCGMAFRFKSALRQHLLKSHCLATLKKRKPVRVGSSSLS